MSQGGKNCKTGTKFTIRDTQHNGRTQRDSLFYLSQKQDRNTNPDRKGLSILSNEEKHSKSESGLRSTLREKCRSPEQETQLRGDLNHFIRQSLWVLVYVRPVIFFLHSLVLRPSPMCMCIFSIKWIPSHLWVRVHTYYGSPPFLTLKEPSCACAEVKSSLNSGVGTLSLYFSRARLQPLALSPECLGENKASILLH